MSASAYCRRTEPSERERVVSYIEHRIEVAFNLGDEEQACNLHRMHQRYESMTNEAFDAIH